MISWGAYVFDESMPHGQWAVPLILQHFRFQKLTIMPF